MNILQTIRSSTEKYVSSNHDKIQKLLSVSNSALVNKQMKALHRKIINDIENNNTLNKIKQKRSVSSDGWACESFTTWRDLGNLHYPRFVKEVTCTGSTCMRGFYSCQSQVYPVRVLAAREENDEPDVAIPPLLRDEWKFMKIEISVGCVCGR